ASDGELLGHVDEFVSAVIALAGIAFRVFVGELRSLRFEHARAGVILGSDELDAVFLALALAFDCAGRLGIKTTARHRLGIHRREPAETGRQWYPKRASLPKFRTATALAPRHSSRSQDSRGCSHHRPAPAGVHVPGGRPALPAPGPPAHGWQH